MRIDFKNWLAEGDYQGDYWNDPDHIFFGNPDHRANIRPRPQSVDRYAATGIWNKPPEDDEQTLQPQVINQNQAAGQTPPMTKNAGQTQVQNNQPRTMEQIWDYVKKLEDKLNQMQQQKNPVGQ